MPVTLVHEVAKRERVIDAVIARAKRVRGMQGFEDCEADYARHLIVAMSGYVEKAVKEIILAYVDGKAPPQVLSYLEVSLNRLTNVDTERLANVVGAMDLKWRGEVEGYVVERRLEALNSVIGLRNDIAHGGGGSVSLGQVEEYWASLKEVVRFLNELLAPAPIRRSRVAR